MRISDWSSDVCSSDLRQADRQDRVGREEGRQGARPAQAGCCREAGQGTCGSEAEAGGRQAGGSQAVAFRAASGGQGCRRRRVQGADARSEEHTSELQSLMRISYAVFCLKKKKQTKQT